MVDSEYDQHDSVALNEIFAAQEFPHQGQNPMDASVVFFGLDANYSPGISDHAAFFERIIEYHNDGVGFWKRYGVHHPFLQGDYPLKKNTGGVPYHRKFTWLGLDDRFADTVSFVELIPVPTTGRTDPSSFWQLFQPDHARRIDALVESGERRMIVLSKSVADQYMRVAAKRYGVFLWLLKRFQLGHLGQIGKTVIYGAPHFSSTMYKKSVFEAVGDKIRRFCGPSLS